MFRGSRCPLKLLYHFPVQVSKQYKVMKLKMRLRTHLRTTAINIVQDKQAAYKASVDKRSLGIHLLLIATNTAISMARATAGMLFTKWANLCWKVWNECLFIFQGNPVASMNAVRIPYEWMDGWMVESKIIVGIPRLWIDSTNNNASDDIDNKVEECSVKSSVFQ